MTSVCRIFPVVLLVAALAVGCTRAETAQVTVAPFPTDLSGSATATSPPNSQTTPQATGTLENPYRLGDEISLNQWSVTIDDVIPDNTEAILEVNSLNAEPEPDRQFFQYSVRARFDGEGSAIAWSDLGLTVVSADGERYGLSMDDYCGVVEDALLDHGEQFSGATVQGNQCVAIRSVDVDGALLRVTDYLDPGEPVFVALD